MKRTLLLPIATVALSGLLAAAGFAQNPDTPDAGPGVYEPAHPRVNQVDRREQRQQHRIAEGVGSGQLTAREAARLQRQQQHIANQQRRDMAMHEGHLTRREQIQLNREQNHASRNIYAKKHNTRVR